MGSWAERTCGKGVAGRPREVADCGLGGPTFCADKLGGTKGEQNRLHKPRAPVWGNKASNL